VLVSIIFLLMFAPSSPPSSTLPASFAMSSGTLPLLHPNASPTKHEHEQFDGVSQNRTTIWFLVLGESERFYFGSDPSRTVLSPELVLSSKSLVSIEV
jgi:hypothetical protein